MKNSNLKLKHAQADAPIYADLTNDFAFKIVFTDKEMLLGLLKELLPDLLIEEIDEINTSGKEIILEEVINVAENKLTFDKQEILNRLTDRKATLDIACTTAKGEKINIEMQNEDFLKHFADRSLYYATLEVQEQMTKGKKRYNINPIYSISFLGFNMLNADKYLSRFSLRDDETLAPYQHNKLHFTYIELPKFQKEPDECITLLDKIIYTIKHSKKLTEVPNSFKDDDYMKKMFNFALYANYTETQRKIYEAAMYTVEEYLNIIEVSKEEARAAGLAEGKAEGKLETAKNLLLAGVSLEIIAASTGLTEAEVAALKQN